jgi:arylsulfatase
MVYPAQDIAGQFMATFKEFPPAQKAATFTLDQALEKMSAAATGGGSGKTAA